jgi:hypothetical protein
VDATWVAKAPTANWRTDRIRFRVTAAGKTCPSANEFAFRQRPTTNWELKNVAHASGNGYGLHMKNTMAASKRTRSITASS